MIKDKKFLFIIALIAIMIISVFFRLWKLDSIPPGLYPDVAMNGNDALNTLKNSDFKVFYPDNNGREGLFMWLIAFSFYIFGVSVWSIKVVAAFFGIFTVLGVYLLSKQIFKKISENYELIALLSAFFVAISFWHTLFSRLGFRAIMVPFFLVYGFYFLLKALDNALAKNYNKKKAIIDLMLSGIAFGLGFYTYISYRFVVLLGALILGIWFFIYKKKKSEKEFLKLSAWCVASMIIVALPIGIYFLLNPGDFFGRAAGVSVLNEKNPLFSLLKSIVLHLGMFNFYGDGNWRHNYAGSPELLWPVGIFFIVGFILSIKDLIVSIKKKDDFKIATHSLLISWFFIMLLSCFLSGEGAPHALRAIGVIPVVYIFSGFGAFWIFSKLKRFFKTKIQLAQLYFVISIMLLVIGYAEFNKYFYEWGKNTNVLGAYSQNYADLGNKINEIPDDIPKYVIVNQSGVLVNDIPVPAQTPIFLERATYGNTRAKYLLPSQIDAIKEELDTANETIIFLMSYDTELAAEIINLFPNGNFYNFEGFYIYKINKIPQIALPEAGCNCGK